MFWAIVCIVQFASAQNVVWANEWLLSGNKTIVVNAMCTNAANETITAGLFSDSVDFDPGPGMDILNDGYNLPHNTWSSYVCKTSNTGTHLWAKAFSLQTFSSAIQIYDVNTDGGGDIYVVGRFQRTIDFDPGPGVDSLNSSGSSGAFVVKLDASGNYIWGKTLLHNDMYMYTVKTDLNNHVIVCGNFESTVDFDPGAGVFNLTASGTNQLFVLKLDTGGDFLWANTWAYARPNLLSHSRKNLDVDNLNNIYISGKIDQSPFDLDPGSSIQNDTGTSFIVKLDAAGNYVWGYADSVNTPFIKYSVNSDVYVFGRKSGLPSNLFVTKFNNAGTLIWTKNLKNPIIPGSNYTGVISSITEAMNGNLLIAGLVQNSYFLYQCDSSGNFLWVKQSPATLNKHEFNAQYNTNNELMLSGEFRDLFDVNFGAGVENLGQTGSNGSFLVKYNYCGNNQTFNLAACDSIVLPDTTLFVTANYVKEYLDLSNCDSNVFIHAVVQSLSDTTIIACDSVVYNGQTFTQSGTYTQIVTPPAPGCDSIKTISVFINTPSGQQPFLNLIQTLQPVPQAGAYVWAHNIEVDSLYNIYVSGEFNHSCDFNPLGSPYYDSSFYPMYNMPDGLLTKYDSSGILTWMHKFQTLDPNGHEAAVSIRLNDTLDLHCALRPYRGTYVFNNSGIHFGTTVISGFSMPSNFGYAQIQKVVNDPTSNQIIKIGSTDFGNFTNKILYIQRGDSVAIFPTGGNYLGYEGAVDLQGNIYVAGNMQTLQGGSTYCSLVKLDSNLNMLWNKQIGKGDEYGFTPQGLRINSIQVDANGQLLLCGRFADSVDIDISSNIYMLKSNGDMDAFVAKFDTAANLIWAHAFGGVDDDVANSITTDLNGKLYVGGNFGSSIDLDPTDGISFLVKGCSNSNWNGGFISKFKPDGTFLKAMGVGSYISELQFKSPNRIYASGSPFVHVFEIENDTLLQNTLQICAGDSVTIGNSIYTQTGVYHDTFFVNPGVDSIVVTQLTVNPLPVVIAHASDTMLCIGDPVILYGSGADSFSWNNSVIDSVAFYPSNSTVYVVTGTDVNGCKSQDSIAVFTHQIPFPDLIFSGDTLYCTNVSAINYYWFKDSTAVDSLKNYYVVTQNGKYAVLVIDSNGCVGVDTIQVINLSNQSMSSNELYRVFPNPNSGMLTLEFDANQLCEYEITMTDMIGNEIFFIQKRIDRIGRQVLNFNLDDYRLKTGLYLLMFKLGSQRSVVKLEYQQN
jgi:hypothetical protein